jgi:hypothetical protein
VPLNARESIGALALEVADDLNPFLHFLCARCGNSRARVQSNSSLIERYPGNSHHGIASAPAPEALLDRVSIRKNFLTSISLLHQTYGIDLIAVHR